MKKTTLQFPPTETSWRQGVETPFGVFNHDMRNRKTCSTIDWSDALSQGTEPKHFLMRLYSTQMWYIVPNPPKGGRFDDANLKASALFPPTEDLDAALLAYSLL